LWLKPEKAGGGRVLGKTFRVGSGVLRVARGGSRKGGGFEKSQEAWNGWEGWGGGTGQWEAKRRKRVERGVGGQVYVGVLSEVSKWHFFHQFVGVAKNFRHKLGCLCFVPLPERASAHAGYILLTVFIQQLLRENLIMPGQHLVNKSFSFRKSTSTTISSRFHQIFMCVFVLRFCCCFHTGFLCTQ